MKVIQSEQIIMWDVDQTLILHGKLKKRHKAVLVTNPHSGEQFYLRAHEPHIRIMKDRKSRGATNIVWSAGGWQWAQAVVVALGLQEYVDLVQSKPVMYVDDKPSLDILGAHLYLEPDDNYGK